MENQYAIEMLHITKKFPGIIANDDVTIQLKKGEIHALLGENGAGKSTLMSVLFGLYQAEEGIIKKDGKEVHIKNPNDANGKKRKDVKNPDKNLRNTDIDKVVIIKGLKYIKEDKMWGDTKIYDPSKGFRVNVTAEFVSANKLKLRGTVFGVGTTIYWQKLK